MAAYLRGEGIPEFNKSAEEIQKMDPYEIAKKIGYQRAVAKAGGSDISPTSGGTYLYPGYQIDTGDGYVYTVPGEQNITNPEELLKSVINTAMESDMSGVDIDAWNRATNKAQKVSSDPAYPDQVPAWVLYKQLTSTMP